MFLKEVQTAANEQGTIDTWLGYNHNYRISAGEFYDMENLCADQYPLLVPRKIRKAVIEVPTGHKIRGILQSTGEGGFMEVFVLENTTLDCHNKWTLDLSSEFGSDTTR